MHKSIIPSALVLDRVRVQGQAEVHQVRTLVAEQDLSPAFLEAYQAAFELEQDGRWRDATAAWEAAPSPALLSRLVNMRLERCQRFELEPPTDWDGVVAWAK